MKAFYNEIDAYCCAWLSNLMDAGHITPGKIDGRPIQELTGNDLRGYDRVHLFAGIAGWELALQLAGWPADMPIWTGSCPCQPFSVAGNRKGTADERHLWPEMCRLVCECRPPYVIGEQVEGAVKHGWLDGVFTDLERENYSCGAAVLGAHSASAPHIRQRLFWVANADGARRLRTGSAQSTEWDGDSVAIRPSAVNRMGNSISNGAQRARREEHVSNAASTVDGRRPESIGRSAASGCASSRMEHTEGEQVGIPRQPWEQRDTDFWNDYELVYCADGKARRIESGSEPLANGISGRVAVRRTVGQGDAAIQEEHWYNRIGVLRAFGNAIVPQVAAEFIAAFMECSP